VQGVEVPDLRKGPGHYPDSPMPGQLGNAAIAGHRTTYGAPFNRIDELVAGDEITIVTLAGTFHYHVTGQLVVSPKDVYVLDQTPTATLTLTTCNPKFSARQRLVVQAALDLARSPKPVAPPPRVRARSARLSGDAVGGNQSSRLPVVWSGLLAAAVGGLWWFLFRRTPRWWVWALGAIPFLAAYAVFCFYFERVLPPGF
jgi:sortase A